LKKSGQFLNSDARTDWIMNTDDMLALSNFGYNAI
jgi:hypothetical protein